MHGDQQVCVPATLHRKRQYKANSGGEPVEQVSNFVYLGANISGDGTIDRDLDIRIQRGNGAFHQLWKIWNSRTIRTPTTIRIYKAAVIIILLYGAEV